MWVTYLFCKELGRKLKGLSKAGAWSESRTTAHRSVRDYTRLPWAHLRWQAGLRQKVLENGCKGLPASGFGPLLHYRFWPSAQRQLHSPPPASSLFLRGKSRSQDKEPEFLNLSPVGFPHASGSQTPRQLLTLQVLLPLGRAPIQTPIPQRSPRLHVWNSQIMSRSHLGNSSAPPNVKASTQAPQPVGGTLPVRTCASAGAGPCATWVSPTEGVRGPQAIPEVQPRVAKEPRRWATG